MSEYRWKWIKPDREGVYLNAGFNPDEPLGGGSVHVIRGNSEERQFGWYCYVMGIPNVLPPKKTVMKRLWLRHEESLPDDPGYAVYEERWEPIRESLEVSDGWLFTEKKKEFEE